MRVLQASAVTANTSRVNDIMSLAPTQIPMVLSRLYMSHLKDSAGMDEESDMSKISNTFVMWFC